MISLLDRYKQQWNPVTSMYRCCHICCPDDGNARTFIFETTTMACHTRAINNIHVMWIRISRDKSSWEVYISTETKTTIFFFFFGDSHSKVTAGSRKRQLT
jgi:hypothetical protein